MSAQQLHFRFEHQKDDQVTIFYREKAVTILNGARAIKFLNRVSGVDTDGQQLEMAKVTGNFKRGNERSSKRRGI